MKRKTAKELLAESFRELTKTKSADKITIQDITENCGYSPATFYRNFKDKYDLIAWDYSQHISKLMEGVMKHDRKWRQTLLDGILHYHDEKEYLTNLLKSTSGHDSFIRYMSEIHIDKLKELVRELSGDHNIDKQTEVCIRLYCMGTSVMNCEWILGKLDVTAEELTEVYEKSLPEPLRKYFL